MGVSETDSVLEFLRKNGFFEAESALRDDIVERQDLGFLGSDELPRLPPVRIVLGHRFSGDLNDGDSNSSFDSAGFLSMASYADLGLGSECSPEMRNPYRFSTASPCKSECSSDRLSEFGTARDSEINNPCPLWDSDMYLYDGNERDFDKQSMPLDLCFGSRNILNCPSEDKFVTTIEVKGAQKNLLEQCESLKSVGLDSSEFLPIMSTSCIGINLEKGLGFPMSDTSIEHVKDYSDLEKLHAIGEKKACHYRHSETELEHGVATCEGCTERYSCSLPCCDCCIRLSELYGEESGARSYDHQAREKTDDSNVLLCGSHRLSFDNPKSLETGKLGDLLYAAKGNSTTVTWKQDLIQYLHQDNLVRNQRNLSVVSAEKELPRRSDPNFNCASDHKVRGASKNSLTRNLETDFDETDFSRDSGKIAEQTSRADGNAAHEPEDEGKLVGIFHDPSTIEDAEEQSIDNELHMHDNHEEEYEIFDLRIIHRKNRTGFEENKDLPIILNTIIAGRYYVTEYLGSAAFSKVIQAHDLQTGMDVCMKIIKNDKDYFDQSLDEIKLLKLVNRHDPADKYHLLRLYDYFYHQEHLFIVCELLRANLYEFQKFNQDAGGEIYFTLPRLQAITRQCLEALEFLHHLGIIHCDLKPENILVKSYSRCEVKIIDLGSSCFQTDNVCMYVQSRSYRAPEVILGLPYDQKIDIWSLGCILAELSSGDVLFPNESLVMMLARMIGMIGPIDMEMLVMGQETHKYFTTDYDLYQRNEETDELEYVIPNKSSLSHHLVVADVEFANFIGDLLQINPKRRLTAREALEHPWLSYPYDSVSC